MITNKAYMMANFDKYGITVCDGNYYFHKDECRPITKDEFLGLLNILEAHGENLESFHDAAFNGTDFFCDIWVNYSLENDSETYDALMQFNNFIPEKDFPAWFLEHVQNEIDNYGDYNEAMDYIKDEAFDLDGDSTIVKTEDGYVHIVRY